MGLLPLLPFSLRSNPLVLFIITVGLFALVPLPHASANSVENGNISTGALANVDTVVVSPIVEDTNLPTGVEFDVVIQADDVDDLFGAKATLSFNPNLLELVGSEASPIFSSCLEASNQQHPGILRLVIICDPDQIEDGFSGSPLTLWTVTLKVIQDTGQVANTSLSIFEDLLNDGQVPPQVIPSIGETTDLTLLDGVCGDQDESGMVDVLDAITDLLIIVELIIPSPLQMLLSDVVIDGDILITDTVLMLKHIVNSEEIEECGLRDDP